MITKIILLVCAVIVAVALCVVVVELEGIHDKIILVANLMTTDDNDLKRKLLKAWEEV